jgi:hypothetical protein
VRGFSALNSRGCAKFAAIHASYHETPSGDEVPRHGSAHVVLWFGIAFLLAFGAIELADAVGAELEYALLDPVLFVFTSASGSCTITCANFGQRAGIFEAREANDAMPFATALPGAGGVLSGFLGSYGQGSDERTVGGVSASLPVKS